MSRCIDMSNLSAVQPFWSLCLREDLGHRQSKIGTLSRQTARLPCKSNSDSGNRRGYLTPPLLLSLRMTNPLWLTPFAPTFWRNQLIKGRCMDFLCLMKWSGRIRVKIIERVRPPGHRSERSHKVAVMQSWERDDASAMGRALCERDRPLGASFLSYDQ